ncbi:glycosyltransferase family 4 protein [Kribbia dieselivorans]|uniref:glycosyltransferase family 4 protein n=1 Tax=Kribbia dieselivorans TaxID=331526 RepID=UPI000838FB4E|nr:glycosyltransferase family 4 protein [Kribbia dieselivorans]
MTRILQICPVIGPGTGVGAVAYHLEEEWRRAGHEVERFTLAEAGGGWLPEPGAGAAGKLAIIARVVWFSTVGTVLAKRRISTLQPDVTVCHNDALAGDVYVNHGIVLNAMKARGSAWLRMIRNPLHVFTYLRDRLRYESPAGPHRLVINLVQLDDEGLRSAFPRLRVPTAVVGNGVDTAKFRPPTTEERRRARDEMDLSDGDVVWLFVGHEYDRKGLPVALEALALADVHHHLVVVGGTADMVDGLTAEVTVRGLTERVHVIGQVSDPRPYFHTADVFVFPTLYESYGLVVLEALACGVPVVTTDTGCARDVLTPGVNGTITPARATEVAAAVRDLTAIPRDELARASRAAAEKHTWTAVAQQYLTAFEEHGLLPRAADDQRVDGVA